jgi:NAD(P)H dehydrogenase (quinone)
LQYKRIDIKIMKIAITGAAGQLGRLVVDELKRQMDDFGIVAIVRSAPKAQYLGVEIRVADYDLPDAMEKALIGIDRLLLISGSEVGKRITQHSNIIQAAKKAGVKWIVYTSLLHADRSSLSLAGEHVATENLLKTSGIPHTILRNGWYTENYTGSVPAAVNAGALLGSAGEGKISAAARIDYAVAAARVISNDAYIGKTLELSGDLYFTLADLAAEVSKQTGKNIIYRNLSEQEYVETLLGFGIPDQLAHAIAGWDVSASKGDLFNQGHDMSDIIGRDTTSLSESIKNALAQS